MKSFCVSGETCIGLCEDTHVNPVKTKRRLPYLKLRPSSYRAVNTFHLGYKIQSVYVILGKSRCLF